MVVYDGMARVSLGHSVYTLIDDSDLHLVEGLSWHKANGYAVHSRYVGPNKPVEKVRMHRLILGLGRGDAIEVDHVNGDGLDNRRANLRKASRALNMQNRARGGYGRSCFRGVSYKQNNGRWLAKAKMGGKDFHIGVYDTEKEAGMAAASWRREHMPGAIEKEAT